jgi:hemoglobin
MKTINSEVDIEALVHQFYDTVLKDEILSPFFKALNLEQHLPKMVDFWCFALLNKPGYSTNVTEKHLQMPLKAIHFERWLSLFNQTVDSLFIGELAEDAKKRAQVIGLTIQYKLDHK